MDVRRLSDDIVVLRDPNDRAVLVRGNNHYTAIDVPTEKGALRELLDASLKLSRGINLAILTHDIDDRVFSGGSDMRVVRGDRNPASPWKWDSVPQTMLRNPNLQVQLVRGRRTLHDDTGRAFHVERCGGSPSTLAVRIDPENVLVVCDDLRPDLPPRLGSASVEETVRRYQGWLRRAPEVLVPGSGIPIAGEEIAPVLERSITYLKKLNSRIQIEMADNRYPWERLAHTVLWCDYWDVPGVTNWLLERHRSNIRNIAAGILRLKFPEMAEMVAA